MIKPGWQKSEFYLTAFAVIATALKAFGIAIPGAPPLDAQTAALVVAVVTGLYTVARSLIYLAAARRDTPPAATPAPAPVAPPTLTIGPGALAKGDGS